jgi:cytoskeletal protein CcmA (bactofilin family)
MNVPGNPSDKKTIIEEGSELKGTLVSSCGVVVRGRLDGEIETPALTVSPTGTVHGRAKVGQVESEGELSGEFDADFVRLAGRVRDNTVIRARSIEVKLDAGTGKMQLMFGECELAVGDEPLDEAAKKKKGKRDGKSEAPPPPEASFDPGSGTS